jgi:hypothetical protein
MANEPEVGQVRATIDVEKLNAYLAKQVADVKTPVEVKQFKVRPSPFPDMSSTDALFQFGQVRGKSQVVLFSYVLIIASSPTQRTSSRMPGSFSSPSPSLSHPTPFRLSVSKNLSFAKSLPVR